MDDLNQDLITTKKSREQNAMQEQIQQKLNAIRADREKAQRRDTYRANEAASQAEAEASRPGVIQTGAAVAVETVKELGKSLLGGARDAAQSAIDIGHEFTDWYRENYMPSRLRVETWVPEEKEAILEGQSKIKDMATLPEVPDNETLGGGLARGITQFALPFFGYVKALKFSNVLTGASKGAAVAEGVAANALTNATAFDPHEARLSNLILDMTDNNPAVAPELWKFLAADEGDTAAEGRLKLVLEGQLVDPAMIVGLVQGFRATRAYFKAKGKPLTPETAKAVRAEKTELTVDEQIAQVEAESKVRAATKQSADEAAAKATTEASERAARESEALVEYHRTKEEEFWQKFADGEIKNPIHPTPDELAAGAVSETAARAAVTKASDEAAAAGAARASREAVALEEAGIIPALDEVSETPETALAKLPPAAQALVKDKTITLAEAREYIVKAAEEVTSTVRARAAGKPKAPKAKKEPVKAEKPAKPEKAEKAAPEQAPAAPETRDLIDIPTPKAGSTVFYKDADGNHWSGEVKGLSKNGKLIITDDTTGKKLVKDPRDVEVEQNLNDKSRQAGFANPILLSRLASGTLAGLYGATTVPEDAPLGDKLLAAGIMAAAGAYAGGKVPKIVDKLAKALKSAPKAIPQDLDPVVKAARAKKPVDEPVHPVVNELARPENAGVSPVKKPVGKPRLRKDVVEGAADKFADAVKHGKVAEIADMVDVEDFNLSRIDSGEEAEDVINAFSVFMEKEISRLKGGVRPHSQTEALAKDLGSGMKSLEEMYAGTHNLDAKFLAHRVLLVASAKKLVDLAKAAETGSEIAVLAARKQAMIHGVIQAKMKKAQTEIARALSAMRIRSNAGDLVLNEVNDVLEGLGGAAVNRKYLHKLAVINAHDTRALHQAVRKTPWRIGHDVVYEIFVNGILSGPSTLAVNMLGGAAHLVFNPMVKTVGTAIGKIRRDPMAGDFVDVANNLRGTFGGLMDALSFTKRGAMAGMKAAGYAATGFRKGNREKASQLLAQAEAEGDLGSAWLAFLKEEPSARNPLYSTDEKLVNRGKATEEAIMRGYEWVQAKFGLGNGATTFAQYFADVLGATFRVGTRLMLTSDEILWAMNYRGSLQEAAGKFVKANGITDPDEMARATKGFLEAPDERSAAVAVEEARTGTYTNHLDGWLKSGQHMMAASAAKFLIPFYRTPVNLFRYNFKHTPGLAMLVESARDDIAAGGVRRDMAIARQVVGMSMIGTAYWMYQNGMIVGSQEADSSAERIGGQQNYSFVTPDGTHVSFRKMDPNIAWFFGATVDVVRTAELMSENQMDEALTALTVGISNNVLSKSYLTGFVNFVDAFTDKYNADKKVTQFLGSMGSALAVPNSMLLRTIRREEDPVRRDVNTILDAIKDTIPGWSKTLPPVFDPLGEQEMQLEGLGWRPISPATVTKLSDDPARKFIFDLDIDLDRPSRTIGGTGGSPAQTLPPKAYSDLTRLVGEVKVGGLTFKERVSLLAKKFEGAQQNPEGYRTQAEEEVRAWHNLHKKAAERELLKMPKYARIRDALGENAVNALRARQGLSTSKVPSLEEFIDEQ